MLPDLRMEHPPVQRFSRPRLPFASFHCLVLIPFDDANQKQSQSQPSELPGTHFTNTEERDFGYVFRSSFFPNGPSRLKVVTLDCSRAWSRLFNPHCSQAFYHLTTGGCNVVTATICGYMDDRRSSNFFIRY